MAKKIKTVIKINLPAGEATPAPPLGPALGQHGVAIMEFVKQYNDKTRDQKGNIVPAVITIYEDRTFTFVTKKAPVADMIKKALNLEKGSSLPGRPASAGGETLASLSRRQVEEIAKEKMDDLNTTDLKSAIKTVEGTARSMGIKIE